MKLYEYVCNDSLIHNLDPRTKLIWLFGLSTLVFITNNPIIIVGAFALILVAFWFSRIYWSILWNNVKMFVIVVPIPYILLFILLLKNIPEGISQGIVFTLKIWTLIFGMVIFSLTTSPRDFLLGLTKLKVPFAFAFMLTIAVRFIPVIIKEFETVTLAQKARAYEISWSWKNPKKSLDRFLPILIPTIMLLIKRSYTMSLAIESKAFNTKKQRTYPKRIKFKPKDIILSMTILVIIAIVYILRE